MEVNNNVVDNVNMHCDTSEIGRIKRVAENRANRGDNSKRARSVLRSSPPPFLLKLYEMVMNPETNSIISWSHSKKSFIVWDTIKFSVQLLPNYFRCNFSSFIYQLNNYGFKKVTWERFEYANQWFEEGKQHWLKNIKRRDQEQIMQERESSISSIQPTKVEMEASIEKLKTEQLKLELEIHKVRQQQGKLRNEVATSEECFRVTQTKQEKMLTGLVPMFIQLSVIQHLRENQELVCFEPTKKPRHVGPMSLEVSSEPEDKFEATGQSVDSEKHFLEETTIMKSLSSSDNSGSSTQGLEANAIVKNADDSAFWKKLLEDNFGCGDEEQGDESPRHL